jgi:hypothetical protein
MANKDLLKEAIAEAKTIRETAIANAREALEETITPHLRDMLAAKLQEMETEEVDEVVEDAVAEEVNEEEELAEAEVNEEEVTEEEVTEAEVSEEEVAVAEADDDSEESEEEAEEEEGEGEEAEEEVEVKDMEVEDLKNMIRDILAQELGHEGEEELDAVDGEMDAADDMVAADDEIDLNELLAQLEEMAKEDEMDETVAEETTEESVEEAKHDDEEAMEEGQGNVDAHEENPHDQLEEALAAVEQLKAELQEVNLLNSKLLYVNKLFKANNLTESQKVNVITAFDKAETVKEVKLVYETVSENLVSTPAKQTVKEHKSFASAPAGNSTKGEVINEVSDAVRRMQKLAGIIS